MNDKVRSSVLFYANDDKSTVPLSSMQILRIVSSSITQLLHKVLFIITLKHHINIKKDTVNIGYPSFHTGYIPLQQGLRNKPCACVLKFEIK